MCVWYNGLVSEYKRNPNTACRICKRPIYRRPGELERSKSGVYCSQVCYGTSMRKEHPCLICGAPILAGANKKTCSRACSNKNRAGIKYRIGRPKDKVVDLRRIKVRLFSSRGKKCERCGYSLHQILQVHHKDRNRENNNILNLELLCPNCHTKEHYVKM